MPSIGDSYSLNSNDLSVELSTTDTMSKKKMGMVERRAIIIVAQRSKYYEEKKNSVR